MHNEHFWPCHNGVLRITYWQLTHLNQKQTHWAAQLLPLLPTHYRHSNPCLPTTGWLFSCFTSLAPDCLLPSYLVYARRTFCFQNYFRFFRDYRRRLLTATARSEGHPSQARANSGFQYALLPFLTLALGKLRRKFTRGLQSHLEVTAASGPRSKGLRCLPGTHNGARAPTQRRRSSAGSAKSATASARSSFPHYCT